MNKWTKKSRRRPHWMSAFFRLALVYIPSQRIYGWNKFSVTFNRVQSFVHNPQIQLKWSKKKHTHKAQVKWNKNTSSTLRTVSEYTIRLFHAYEFECFAQRKQIASAKRTIASYPDKIERHISFCLRYNDLRAACNEQMLEVQSLNHRHEWENEEKKRAKKIYVDRKKHTRQLISLVHWTGVLHAWESQRIYFGCS